MMPAQIEHRVLQLADAVRARNPVEDSRVELKATWPTADHKFARRLAALANAARLEPVLLVIGLDEKQGTVSGAPANELAMWWPQVQACFADMPPILLHSVNVPVDGATVVGLMFDTSRAPFVVKVPNASPFDREVPWREGTSTRSATRADLIRILVPRTREPRLEALQCWLLLNEQKDLPNAVWNLDLRFYVTPVSPERIFMPFHKCEAIVRIANGPEIPMNNGLELGGIVVEDWPTNVTRSVGELIISGPGLAQLTAAGRTVRDFASYALEFEFVVTLETTDEHRLSISGRLLPTKPSTGSSARWKLDGHRALLYLEDS